MGLFGNIMKNFNHGGVDVRVQAPTTISMQDASFIANVSVTAKDSPQTIKSVVVELLAESHDNNTSSSSSYSAVSRAENNEPFSLAAGETRTIQVNVYMNAGSIFADQMPANSPLAQMAGPLQALSTAVNMLGNHEYTYGVRATVDVDGIMIDPSDRQPIHLLKPGEFGSGLNIHV